jgi:general nucleoside transport system ATP-binding protein
VLEIQEITKTFGPIVANDRISIRVERATVHALLGENGAGKSTLMNVLYGLYRPDAGRILLDGRPVVFHSPRDAIRAGVGMIHQHFMLVPPLSVAENIVLGHDPLTRARLDLGRAEREIGALSRAFGLDVDPGARVWQLPVGQQQRVEILKALYRKADLLILDEPTSVLTPGEAQALFAIIRRLRDDGRTVIFISHKLDEVMAISDTITVLRAGRVVETVPRAATGPEALARAMVGRDVIFRVSHDRAPAGEAVLEVEGLEARSDRGLPALRAVSFTVHRGEILGVAGVDGNGQGELAECIAGLRRPTGGRVRIAGRDATGRPPREVIGMGLGFIPADRQKVGLVLDFDIGQNVVLKRHREPPFCRGGFMDGAAVRRAAAELIGRFDIRASGPRVRVRTLSGGNQQKVVLAREVSGAPAVLVAMQPTRGLDVGATEYVQRTLLAQRDRGAAILYISTELDEVLNLSDRIAVLFQGEIVGILDAATATAGTVGLLMAGQRRPAP